MNLFKKKKGKEKAIVFVDYEHWYYSYRNLYSMTPDVAGWCEELKENFDVAELLIFADFSERNIGSEREKLEQLTTAVIHTGISRDSGEKDFTDFIMLDYLYQKAFERNDADVFILFTGDGHFDSVVRYLRNKQKKRVIVYGVRRAFSGRLKSEASSYVEMPRYVQEQQFYVDLICRSLANLDEQKRHATYWKTVRVVAEYNRVTEERIQSALDYLLEKHYLYEEESLYQGRKCRLLKAHWDRLAKDGLWEGRMENAEK